MKKILSVLTVLLVLASCGGGYNPPTITDGISPEADFSYEIKHPLKVSFINKSKYANYYEWDFGDGFVSTDENPEHKYSSKGVYKVTLKARRYYNTSDIMFDTYTMNIQVEEPTKCYVTGIVYERIPKNNEYYNIRFTDDYVLFETLYWYTDWVLLSSANMPYTYMLKSKKQIDFSKSEYVMRLHQNRSASGDGSQIVKWTVYPSDLKKNFSEQTTGTANNAKVTLLLEWTD